MTIIPRLLFVLAMVVAPIVVWQTSVHLPARVATHFASGGYANGYMTHDGYVLVFACGNLDTKPESASLVPPNRRTSPDRWCRR